MIPASVHKGIMGEEAVESRKKLYRKYRELHARKISREVNLNDIFVRTIVLSDPLISSINLESQFKQKLRTAIELPDVVKDFLQLCC